jgi:hypothetical protein
MHLVATSIPRLLSWRPVIPQAVRLDDQAELGPKEVDTKAEQQNARPWDGKPAGTDQPEEHPLEL